MSENLKIARVTAAKIVDNWFGNGDANYLRETGSLENAIAAALSSATARGEAQERERNLKIIEAQIRTFQSEQYAMPQPMGSFSEVFACNSIAAAIQAKT